MTKETHSFQAEVKQVLDIVINSLYTEKETFVRELVSNASDSLEKLRHLQIDQKEIFDDNLNLEILITTDETAKTLTIQDFGIGMTNQELIENIGTIAHSGSKKFLESLKNKGTSTEQLIGQFGVGFYSAFMVAKNIVLHTHSWDSKAEGYRWECDGSSSFTIESEDGQRRGCKIVIHLKDECSEFSKESVIKSILEKYSNFVPFPISLNGSKINNIQAIWMKNKNDISEKEYQEFYKFQANAFDDYLLKLHFNADAPLAINSLIFVPKENPEHFGFDRIKSKVALYCKKILIDSHPKGLLPDWLRFLSGIIDCSDLPLNISRETIQDNSLIRKLGQVITNRFIKLLEETSEKNPEIFETFWKQFGIFIREGILTDHQFKQNIIKLLRFESSQEKPGKLIGLNDYFSRMKEGQEIYYAIGQNREILEKSPYLEVFRKKNIEVIFSFDPSDDFIMRQIGNFESKMIVSVDQCKSVEIDQSQNSDQKVSEEEMKNLCNWIESMKYPLVDSVLPSKRLVDHPIVAIDNDSLISNSMKQIMKQIQKTEMPTKVRIELNPGHNLIRSLVEWKKTNEQSAKLLAEQLIQNALFLGGFVQDSTSFVEKNYELLNQLVANR